MSKKHKGAGSASPPPSGAPTPVAVHGLFTTACYYLLSREIREDWQNTGSGRNPIKRLVDLDKTATRRYLGPDLNWDVCYSNPWTCEDDQ